MLGGGRSLSIRSEKSGSGMAAAMGASGADALPWSWKECTLPRVYEAYEVCLMLHALRSENSVPPEVDSKVSRSLLPLGLTVLQNRNQLAGASSCGTCLRARMVLSRAGVVLQMDRKA
jgi:hypothetical protein